MGVLCCGLALLVMTACFINTYGAPITCNAGTYVVGQPASITCNFRENIAASQQSFNMARYPPTAKKGEIGTDVLVCHWSVENQEHDCTVTYGYTFDKVITDQVEVKISKAEEEFEGLYMCFFVPSQGKDNHACDFKITIKPIVPLEMTTDDKRTDQPTDEGDTQDTLLIVITSVIAAVVLLVVLPVMVYFIYQKKVLRQTGESKGLISPKDKQTKDLLEPLKLSQNNMREIRNIMERGMGKTLNNSSPSKKGDTTQSGTDNNTRSETDIKMSSIFVPVLTEPVTDDVLVVDFGRTHLEVVDVKLRKQCNSVHSASYEITKKTTATQLFEHIIDLIHVFVCDNSPDAHTRIAVLVIPFPCNQTSLEKATLTKWTQEFSRECATSVELHELLREALKSKTIGKKPCRVKFVAIVNDNVNTLVSVADQNPKCKIGLVAGNGFKACYIDQWTHDNTANAKDEQKNKEIYNTEVGALGENLCLDVFRTEYDKELDKSSMVPRQQILEKMVSWVYIGEIVRLALKRLREKDLLLLSGQLGCDLFTKSCLTADLVAEIDGDTEEPYAETERILKVLGVGECTEEDLRTVRYVCRLVTDRAAKLAGAVLACLINRLNEPGVIVVVDGELNRRLPRFGKILYSTTNELVTPELQDKFYLVSPYRRATIVGAARIAQTLVRRKRTSTASTS